MVIFDDHGTLRLGPVPASEVSHPTSILADSTQAKLEWLIPSEFVSALILENNRCAARYNVVSVRLALSTSLNHDYDGRIIALIVQGPVTGAGALYDHHDQPNLDDTSQKGDTHPSHFRTSRWPRGRPSASLARGMAAVRAPHLSLSLIAADCAVLHEDRRLLRIHVPDLGWPTRRGHGWRRRRRVSFDGTRDGSRSGAWRKSDLGDGSWSRAARRGMIREDLLQPLQRILPLNDGDGVVAVIVSAVAILLFLLSERGLRPIIVGPHWVADVIALNGSVRPHPAVIFSWAVI